MKVELVISILMGLLTAVGVYLTVFCGMGYSVVVLAYGLFSYFLFKLNHWARYFALFVLVVHAAINLSTVNLLYGTGIGSSAASQLLIEGFDEFRFAIEIGLSSFLVILSLVFLLLPARGRCQISE